MDASLVGNILCEQSYAFTFYVHSLEATKAHNKEQDERCIGLYKSM